MVNFIFGFIFGIFVSLVCCIYWGFILNKKEEELNEKYVKEFSEQYYQRLQEIKEEQIITKNLDRYEG